MNITKEEYKNILTRGNFTGIDWKKGKIEIINYYKENKIVGFIDGEEVKIIDVSDDDNFFDV